ncbi:hypothetical protein AB0F72_14315 [Actinoplanes sp. NPDC023936]|uniref:hypothetical protein n=1 Tax=Actinoplanes sp. NPDC023936 TaxID=3154910 RepID=UPI0034016556
MVTGKTVQEALAVVGLELDALLAAAGSVLDGGHPYLVGSLAAGLGNAGSDVDIHHFRPETAAPAPPYLMFVDGVTVDVEYYPAEIAARTVAGYAGLTSVAVADGRIALATPPARTVEHQLTRWLTALPLRDGSPPLVTGDDRAAVVALLARAAYDTLVQLAAVAALAGGRAGAGYLWHRCGRQALEVACRIAGDLATGDKWLPRRALRTLGGPSVAGAGFRTGDEQAVRELLAVLRLPLGDPLAMTVVQRCDRAREVAIGRTRHLLTRHGRLFREYPAAEGRVATVAAEIGAGTLLHALRTGQMTMRADPSACAEVLR